MTSLSSSTAAYDRDHRTSRNRRATNDCTQSEQTQPRWPTGAAAAAGLPEQPPAQDPNAPDAEPDLTSSLTGPRHLAAVLQEYIKHYNAHRPHPTPIA